MLAGLASTSPSPPTPPCYPLVRVAQQLLQDDAQVQFVAA